MSEQKYYVEVHKVVGSINDFKCVEYCLMEDGKIAPLLFGTKWDCERLAKKLNELYDELQELKDCPVECDVSECLEDCDALLKGYVNNLEKKNRRLEIENKLLERIITDNIKVDNHKGGSFSTSVFPYDMVKTCKVDKEGNITFKF